jgi:Concanavalin A-like lectin/glucanases superfamily
VIFACLLAAGAAACVSEPSTFVCTGSAACVLDGRAGVCEPTGFCSFPDRACASGWRYGAAAGDGLANACAAPDYRGQVLADHPLAYWRLGEPSGSTSGANEIAGGPAGTYEGVTLGVPGATLDGNTAARFVTSIPSGIPVGDFYGFAGNAAFSLEVWLQPTSFPTNANTVFSKTDSTDGYFVDVSPSSFVRVARWSQGVENMVGASTGLVLGRYAHVVITYDGARDCFYVDGAPAGCAAQAQSIGGTSASFTIGRYSLGGSGFDGLIDEVAVYDHVLPADRIAAHRQAATPIH